MADTHYPCSRAVNCDHGRYFWIPVNMARVNTCDNTLVTNTDREHGVTFYHPCSRALFTARIWPVNTASEHGQCVASFRK